MSDVQTPASTRRAGNLLPEFAAFAAAVIGHLPAMGAWWNGADWSRLAVASGLGEADGTPLFWLSDRLYWTLTWPLFGLAADAHSVLRLVLFGLAAVLVVRVAARSGLGPRRRLLAGIVFAASPLAFTPLYWASGVGGILTTVFALAAVERWLAAPQRGRRQLAWASLWAVLAMFSGAAALALPLFFLVCIWLRVGVRLADKAFAWAMVTLQLGAAAAAVALAVGPPGLPATAGPLMILAGLGKCGWWLMSPAPTPALDLSPAMIGAGGALFAGWLVWAVFQVRRGAPPALLPLLAALLALAPAVLSVDGPTPDQAWFAVAPLGLLLGTAVPGPRRPGRDPLRTNPVLGLLAIAAMAGGFFGMESRLGARNDLGLLADPLARATALSWQGCRTMTNLRDHPPLAGGPGGGLTHLTLLQPLVAPGSTVLAEQLGERWVRPTDMHAALGGAVGPRLLLGPEVQVGWANGLTTTSTLAVVLCETATGFRMWGRTDNALLYAALTDVGLNHFARARAALKRAAELNDRRVMFIYDEGQMIIPLQMVVERRQDFVDWTLGLLEEGASPLEVGGLQDMFFNLLSRATGRSVADLTAGSQLVGPARTPGAPR